ncbi:MAG: hypothetical protein ACI4SG_07710 [Oligosphaeraceae bacterium]
MRLFPSLSPWRAALLFLLALPVVHADSTTNPLEGFQRFSETRAWVREAEECLEREDYKGAAKLYGKAAKIQEEEPKKAEFLFLQAQNLLRAKKPHAALEVYTNLLENHIYHIPLEIAMEQLRQLADDFQHGRGTFLGMDDPITSIHIYTMLIRYQADVTRSLDDRLVLAAKQKEEGMVEDAVDTYQQILKALPDNPDARYGLAKLLDDTAAKRDGDGAIGKAAVREARSFLANAAPDDPRREDAARIIQDCRNREAERLWERAQFYLSKYHRKPQVARRYLIDLQRDYDDTPAGRRAKLQLVELFPETEEN